MARPDSSKSGYGRILDRARILNHPTINLYSWASCLVVSEARFARSERFVTSVITESIVSGTGLARANAAALPSGGGFRRSIRSAGLIRNAVFGYHVRLTPSNGSAEET